MNLIGHLYLAVNKEGTKVRVIPQPQDVADLLELIKDGSINRKQASEVFREIYYSRKEFTII